MYRCKVRNEWLGNCPQWFRPAPLESPPESQGQTFHSLEWPQAACGEDGHLLGSLQVALGLLLSGQLLAGQRPSPGRSNRAV